MTLREIVESAYYYDKTGMLLLGDTLQWTKTIPDNSVDIIIADPPYNIGKDGGDGWDTIDNYLKIFEAWVKEWQRVLKNRGLLYCYCSQEFNAEIEIIFKKYMNILNRIIWHYHNGERTATRRFPYSYEPLFLISKSAGEYNFMPVRDKDNIQKGTRQKRNPNGKITITQPHPDGIKFTDVWSVPKLSGNRKITKHPTEKPLELGERMLKSNNGKVVLIPFAGSGTEIVNCIGENKKWIGIENQQKYIDEMIIPRIKNLEFVKY